MQIHPAWIAVDAARANALLATLIEAGFKAERHEADLGVDRSIHPPGEQAAMIDLAEDTDMDALKKSLRPWQRPN